MKKAPGLKTFPSDKGAVNQARLLIVVPAYNEEGSIRAVVSDIMLSPWNLDVLVVNDGSTDQTFEQARAAGVNVISLPFNLGIGGAVQTGFQFALRQGYDLVVQMDGDGQHDVDFLGALVNPILNNEVDMTIGSRFIPPYLGYQSSFVRRIGINFFARLLSALTGSPVTDPTSGFRAYNRKMINIFARYYPHDFPEPEAIVVAGRYGARIREVPVTMRERQAGSSSIRYFKTLYYMLKVTLAILLGRFKTKRG
ncbi:MAG: glycosyltransferase family 2 protein [Candidatus Omnitrophica bacterium]|nr:glycosyltransferase family 2 protein [Candidatus Omnitrophota bacterium]